MGGFVALLICVVVLLMMCGKNRTKPEEITSNKALEAVAEIKIKISGFVLIFYVCILWVLKILGSQSLIF